MKKYLLKNFIRGWFIGDFTPSIIRTKDFEVAIQQYKKGAKESKHVHKIADEFTTVVKGSCTLNGKLYKEGDIVWIKKGEAAAFEAIEDCTTTVVKIPSVIGDKYEV